MADLMFGRKPPKNAPSLRLGPALTGIIPPHPVSADYLKRFTSWQMLGNDRYGDCVAVTWANMRRLLTASLGTAESYPDLTAVESLYKTQNPAFPAQDEGMDIQTCLEYLAKTGGPDGVKAVAFAKVDPSDRGEVEAALAIFGALWVGINVREVNETQFSQGKPWDYDPNSEILGGHSVLSGGYTGVANDSIKFITWAKETGFTDAFVAHDVEEAWVVIWPEHFGSVQFLAGIDISALASAYTALTDRELPIPTPAPAPDTADATFAAALKPWVAARHSGSNAKAAKAAKAWLAAKGL